MENQEKIQRKIDELNAQSVKTGLGQVIPQWVAVPGYFALTGFSNNDGKPVFNPGFGVVVKIFSNTRTGEIKIFSSNLFE